jgi:hypothetical protein
MFAKKETGSGWVGLVAGGVCLVLAAACFLTNVFNIGCVSQGAVEQGKFGL